MLAERKPEEGFSPGASLTSLPELPNHQAFAQVSKESVRCFANSSCTTVPIITCAISCLHAGANSSESRNILWEKWSVVWALCRYLCCRITREQRRFKVAIGYADTDEK